MQERKNTGKGTGNSIIRIPETRAVRKTERMLKKRMIIPAMMVGSAAFLCFAAFDKKPPVIRTKAIAVSYNAKLDSEKVTDKVRVTDEDGEKKDNVTVRIDKEGVNTRKLGTYKTEAKAIDSSGNETRKKIEVRVEDRTAPVIRNIDGEGTIISMEAGSQDDVRNHLKAIDDADGDVTERITIEGSVDVSRPGSYSIKARAADSHGNESTEDFLVQVRDTTPPTIRQTKDKADFKGSSNLADYFAAEDNLGGQVTLASDPGIDTSKEEKQTIHVTATDESGNKAEGDYSIAVGDYSAPEITLTADKATAKKNDKVDPMSFVRSVTDVHDGDLKGSVKTEGSVDTSKAGTYRITYIVSDKAGNEAKKQIEIAVKEEQKPLKTQPVPSSWSGSRLTRSAGVNNGPSGKETYYNLPMGGVVRAMQRRGYNLKYWVRSDGVKMYGDYVMVAANIGLRPYGSIVPTSLGQGMVVDTGSFASSNPRQLDIAVSW